MTGFEPGGQLPFESQGVAMRHQGRRIEKLLGQGLAMRSGEFLAALDARRLGLNAQDLPGQMRQHAPDARH